MNSLEISREPKKKLKKLEILNEMTESLVQDVSSNDKTTWQHNPRYNDCKKLFESNDEMKYFFHKGSKTDN